jgi:signal transduction histidine kinase
MAGTAAKTRHGIRYLLAALALAAALACYLGVTLAGGQEASIRNSEREKTARSLEASARRIGEKMLAAETAALDRISSPSLPDLTAGDPLPAIVDVFFRTDSDGNVTFPLPAMAEGDRSSLDFQALVPSGDADIAAAETAERAGDYNTAMERYAAAMQRQERPAVKAAIAYRAALCGLKQAFPGRAQARQFFREAIEAASQAEPDAAMSYLKTCVTLELAQDDARAGDSDSAAARMLGLYRGIFVERSLRLPAATVVYVEAQIGAVLGPAALAQPRIAWEYDAVRRARVRLDAVARGVGEAREVIALAVRNWKMRGQRPAGEVVNFCARRNGNPVLLAMRLLAADAGQAAAIGFRVNIGAIDLTDLPADAAIRDDAGRIPPRSAPDTKEWASAPFDAFVPGWRLAAPEPPELDARVARQRALTIALTLICVGALALCGLLLLRAVRMQSALEGAKSEFLSNVSHELCTPAASIRVISETLASAASDEPGRRRKYIGMLQTEAERLSMLLDNLLEFSRGRASAARYNIAPGDLAGTAREAVADFARRHEEQDLELASDLPAGPVAAEHDADAMKTALRNILDNAHKFSQSPRRIAVSMRASEGAAEIKISDNGIGIAPGEAGRIFDRFFRGSDERVRAVAGSGIGLTLARDIVTAHGGEVTVQSEPGYGSTFTVTLPITKCLTKGV